MHHFEMCFNDEGQSGVLRLGGEIEGTKHGSIGKLHWGLDLQGVSVGSEQAGKTAVNNIEVCNKDTMSKGQETPCGMIPDSGTTLIMAPRDHLEPVLSSLCDRWDRCSENYTAFEKAISASRKAEMDNYGADVLGLGTVNVSKAEVFHLLLADCDRWLPSSEKGLNELPQLNFHVAGDGGKTDTISLSGWAYVMETTIDEVAAKAMQGGGKTDPPVHGAQAFMQKFGQPKGKKIKMCEPAISSMGQDYVTEKNGPIWIVGTPLFYEYNVGYDMKDDPPSMSFVSQKTRPCGTCNAKLSLAAVDSTVGAEHQKAGRAWRPRAKYTGPPRMPQINLNDPL